MNNPDLGSIISSLHLGIVDNMRTHGSRGDEAAVRKRRRKLLPIHVAVRLFLSSPILGGIFSTVVHAIHIDAHDIPVVLKRAVDHGAFGPGDSGVGDKDIKPAVEVLDRRVDGGFNGLGVTDVELICFA